MLGTKNKTILLSVDRFECALKLEDIQSMEYHDNEVAIVYLKDGRPVHFHGLKRNDYTALVKKWEAHVND